MKSRWPLPCKYVHGSHTYEMVRVSAIAAIGAQSRALGNNNELIWRLTDDLKRFKQLTTGHVVVMGRKTYESIGRPLPNRTNIVVTRDQSFMPEGVVVTHTLDEAFSYSQELENSNPMGEIFIIGGGQIYDAALPYTDRLYLTLIDETGPTDADTFFPDYSAFTKVVSEEKGEHEGLAYTWITLEK